MNESTEARDAAPACSCTHALALSIGTALLAGLLMLAPGVSLPELSATLATGGTPRQNEAAASYHSVVDWQRVQRAPEPAVMWVAADECLPAAETQANP